MNISSIGCPELTSSVLLGISESVDDFDVEAFLEEFEVPERGPKWIYVGFVSEVNVENDDAPPNIARGSDCWGSIVPDGSVGPGRTCIGILRAMSSR